MSDQQKLIASISGSVIGHMLLLILIFLVLTSSRNVESPTGAAEKAEGPKEVTVMMSDLMRTIEQLPIAPMTRLPGQKQFVDTEGSDVSGTKIENAEFESDKDTIAATELLPDSAAPKTKGITMRGGDSRVQAMELQHRDYSDGNPEEQAAAAAKKKSEMADHVFTDSNSKSGAYLLMRELAKSSLSESNTDEATTDGASIAKRQRNVNGTLTNRGKNAVDASATPLGRYKKAVIDAIAERWHQNRKKNSESVTWGSLHLTFSVNSEGEVSKLMVTENKGNDTLLDLTLKAIAEAKLPPMPDEVEHALGKAGLAMNYDVIIY